MTDHPDLLLAEYVDGTLTPEDRARVQSHLEACSSCRQETTLATRAREALAALPEAEPPAALGMPAVREARGRPRRPWARKAAWAVPAAAVLVAGAVLALRVVGDLGNGEPAEAPAEVGAPADEGVEAERAPGEDPRFLAPNPLTRTAETDHDAESLQRLARDLRADVRVALDSGFAPTPTDFYAAFDFGTLPERAESGLECVTNAFSPDPSVVPFLVERSRFEGAPAFVAAFLQAPSPGAEYDRVLIIVADRATCSLQSLATQLL